MKKRRFLLSLCLLSGIILSGFAQAINSSCDGGFIFVTNIDDWNQAQEDFDNNCCAGSSITIYNVTNNTVLEMEAQFDGPNSSCSPEQQGTTKIGGYYMKLSSLFTLTICLIAFSSCQEAKKKVTAEAPTITLIEQKIEITDPEFLSSFNYPKLREFVKSDGSSVLYFFDNLLKSIIFIDELQLTTTHRIALNREGPNGIRSPKDAYILSETEIAVVESSAISIIDHHGNLLRKASRPSNGGFENIFFAFRGSNTHFTQDDSTLFIINNPLSRNDIDFMSKEPLVSSFDLKSMKYEMTKTPLPDKFRFDNAYYDMTNLPYVTPYENKIYLNFRVDKNIFEYTLSTNDLGEIALESKYADPMAPPSDEAKFSVREKAFEDLSNTQTFLDPIITDNYIYRPHSRARNPEINPQHEMYLSVYDKSFQLLLEVNLKEFGLLGLPFRYQNQIAFIKMDPIVEGKLIIHLFKAQKANPK